MTTEEIILAAFGIAIPLGLALYARWLQRRFERDDPARPGRPAE